MRRAALLLALPLLVARPAAAGEGDGEEIAVGRPAPPFSLRTLNPEASGETWIALDRLAGEEPEDPGSRVVLLSFFASWCEPCKRELPLLVQLDRTYREQGLRVVGVSIDRDDAGIAAARGLVAAAKAAYPVLTDRFNLVARRYLGDEAPLPSLFLVRRDGTIARIERGYARDAGQFLLAEVQAALGIARARRAAAPEAKAAAAGRP